MRHSAVRIAAWSIAVAAWSISFSLAAEGGGEEFLAQVRSQFATWDLDRNDELSADEIELAVTNPKVKQKAAATAAALRRAIRSDRDVKFVTLPLIEDNVAGRSTTPTLPKLVPLYEFCWERIQNTRRELFVNDMLDVTKLSQGRLGDCFLLASLGTAAARDPQRLKNMFKPLPNEQMEVTFGTGRKMVLDLPTDAEICIGARNHDDGLWAVAYEKAIGTIYLERQKTKRHVSPLSIIGVGGTPNVPLELLTGHAVKRAGCEDFQRGQLTPEEREAKFAELRAKLIENVNAKRLMVGGTAPKGKQTLVPGLYYNHSYGVLDYDEKTDVVTFWNPFGNGYQPKGEPGLKHGFPTSHGRFSMPLKDAVMWFGSFSIETAEPTTRFAE